METSHFWWRYLTFGSRRRVLRCGQTAGVFSDCCEGVLLLPEGQHQFSSQENAWSRDEGHARTSGAR